VEHLQGRRTIESALEQTKLDVRHYAKRQLTWFRREEGIEWFEAFGDETDTISHVLGLLRP
jgi:tRNA dimethylallyltransferase